MNGEVEKIIDSYSNLLFNHTGKFLALMILFSALIAVQAGNVQTVDQQTEDFLPDSVPVIAAFNFLDAEFVTGGSTTYTILIEPRPDHANSNEIRDVRNPEFLRYVETLSNDFRSIERVDSVQSPADLFKDIPSSQAEVQRSLETLGKSRYSQFISKDFQAVKITLTTSGLDAEQQDQMGLRIKDTVESYDKSSAFDVGYSGQIFIDQAFQNQSQNTMQLTSIASLLGVMLVVILLFRSIYYGLNSLLTVVFGIAIGFGLYGLFGLNITPQTSGAISLGIGIAVDFGIQPIARYREEREDLGIKEALQDTIKGVITPMTIGLIAANIGFLALTVGKLTFLSDLGILLTLTTTMAYVSAFTIIPSAIVLYDRYFTENGTSGFTLSKILPDNTR